jgi:hypothetical protein
MATGLNETIASQGLKGSASFQSVLLNQLGRRMLMEEEGDYYDMLYSDWRDLASSSSSSQQQIVTFSYQLYTVFLQQSGQSLLPTTFIVGIEQQVLLDPSKSLLTSLQAQDPSTGLGSDVTNVWAFVLPSGTTTNNNVNSTTTATTHSNNNNTQLEVIIIVAVVVAGVALSVLALAVVWAWRQDKKRRNPYRIDEVGAVEGATGIEGGGGAAASSHSRSQKSQKDPKRSHAPSPDGTGSSSSSPPPPQQRGVSAAAAARIVSPPPSEIEPSENGGGVYEESLISEDISTSLSAYYRSGLATGSGHTNNTMTSSSLNNLHRTSDHFAYNNNNNDRLNDAGSLSSMESYGYSLDGYNSITGIASLQQQQQQPPGHTASPIMPSEGEIRRVIDED